MKKSSAVILTQIFVMSLVLLLGTGLVAQIQNGIFTGTVLDPQGAAVANATVTITNPDTGLSVKATTNDSGQYVTQPLPVGVYKFSVSAAGFKTGVKEGVKLDVGTTQRLDFKLVVGKVEETVEVTAEASLINLDDSKLSNNVGTAQILNLPLNGRNVYDLLRLTAGAQDARGVITENTGGAVVNGVRGNFNGFLINGVSNKGLSGGPGTQPIEDTVQEFQLLTLNMSAQYGNSAGSVTNLVTKGGTNSFHGSIFEFLRNDVFDANSYFNNNPTFNPSGSKPPLRFNQFGATIGGPIVKDKLFFYAAYQGNRFITTSLPTTTQIEGPEWRQAVIAAAGAGPVARLLYADFAPSNQGTAAGTLAQYIDLGNGPSGFGGSDISEWLCDSLSSLQIAQRIAAVVGVTAADQASLGLMGCTVLPLQAGTFNRALPFFYEATSAGKTRSQGNLIHGNEWSGRIDWNATDKDRIFANFNWRRNTDEFFAASGRGFPNPNSNTYMNGQFSYSRTITNTLINEFKAGYAAQLQGVKAGFPGVPAIGFDDGTLTFGSYNGYPQFFKENIYSYSDMMSWTKGKHNIKFGGDVRRNIENSEFNVGRPSYYFFDPLFFAADAPYGMAAGINPDLANGGAGNGFLSSNIRHWRNLEIGAYFQDDWKITSRLTLNLGIRYDLYTRHNELNNLATTFLLGPGSALIDNVTTGAGQIKDANTPLATCTNPAANARNVVLAGICGPGGFAPAKSLGAGDHNNWGPRLGFAYDVFGTGKLSLRGGAGLSYEGTLYNPLSNSRWNPPYYSFNSVFNFLVGDPDTVVYGPQSGGTVTYTGAPDPLNHQGSGDTAVGNIMGWGQANPNQAVLTGVIFPQGIKDPYVYNYFLGGQWEFAPKWVMELNYVGTTGHKLFRAENVNRKPGNTMPASVCVTDQLGRNLCGNGRRRLNPNYGRLRVWENSVNSNYNSLQVTLKKAMSHGFAFNANYTWSHSIDGGSTWHSGATSSNNRAGGEGFTSDQTAPFLDRGNSIFDVRHTFTANYIYELPWFKNQRSLRGYVLGGWQLNGIFSAHSGAHWSPYCDAVPACDFNGDGERNDRPNATKNNYSPSKAQWTFGWSSSGTGQPVFTRPCPVAQTSGAPLVCNPNFLAISPLVGGISNLGRNTFVGPSFFEWSPSVFKNFKITERVGLQFRWEMFNVLNNVNFLLPGAGGANQNNIRNSRFGRAAGTFNPRQMQFGLKLSF
jgi:hypothetical protein